VSKTSFLTFVPGFGPPSKLGAMSQQVEEIQLLMNEREKKSKALFGKNFRPTGLKM
jgi:hypothetical protein